MATVPNHTVDVSTLNGVPVGRPGPDGGVRCDLCGAIQQDGDRVDVENAPNDAGGGHHITVFTCLSCGPRRYIAPVGHFVARATLKIDGRDGVTRLQSACVSPAVAHDW